MHRTILALAAGALVAGTAASAAGPVNTRQLNQERRIDAGKRSGKLTEAEAARLKAQQSRIRAEVAQMRAHHPQGLTEADKARLTAMQDEADAAIIGQKKDAQRGPNKLKID